MHGIQKNSHASLQNITHSMGAVGLVAQVCPICILSYYSLLAKSLCSAIQVELQEYYRLIAALETQIVALEEGETVSNSIW